MALILFVDDDPLTLALLSKAAELFGHRAIPAHSGTEALRLAVDLSPDIIFVDRQLSDMDGFAVIRCLRATPEVSSIPIVMLSAVLELGGQEAALSAGAVSFVHKPIRLQTLQAIICQYTNERG